MAGMLTFSTNGSRNGLRNGMKKKIAVMLPLSVILLFFAFGRGFAVNSGDEGNDKTKILKFSHQQHIAAGTECVTCHEVALKSDRAEDKNLPTHDVCQTCHEDQVKNTCNFCHLGDEQKALPNPVREFRFSHAKHAGAQKMECTTCHKGLEEANYASAKNLPTMTTCTTCHNDVKASGQCETCHTNLTALRPASHTLGNFKKEHSFLARLNVMDAQCRNCHAESFCAQCHDASMLTQLSKAEKIGMISPRTRGNDKAAVLTGQMVHDINYRFTHGIDAKGRAADCQTCHNAQTFCNDCHVNGSQALGGVIPTSHEAAGFTTIGYGSGGGRHAQLAKRDIESCMACHDAEGGDPTCVKCHMDPDGVKHTNPRTHASGFMSDVHGEWHDNAGASCYSCHLDPNAHPRPIGQPGRGFCGYCHGKK